MNHEYRMLNLDLEYKDSEINKPALWALLLFVFVFNSISLFAQGPIKKLTDFKIEDVTKASMDRLGNLYLITAKGGIKKYDTDGKFMSEYSNPGGPVTLLEPWNPLRLFVYTQRLQEVTLLDRFLVPLEKMTLDPALAIEPQLASPVPNYSFWLLDKADFSLKKVNPAGTQVLQEINIKLPPGSKPEFTFLREYQNLLFLIDANSGVHILSILGKPIRTLAVKNLSYLGFLGEEIYFLENGKIKFFDLYSEEVHELAVDPIAKFVMLTDERMVVVKEKSVEVWEYKP